ncbi:MAG: RnfH family protein [Burkholderiales bacterium]|jgi:hypothetical protein
MARLQAEVVYALPRRQTVIPVELPQGATVYQAAVASGITRVHPEIDLDNADFGIWNERVSADDCISDGDRIEIYRPLVADPKTLRRRRASQQRSNLTGRKR